MLSIRLLGFGQVTKRIAVLQSAITHVLNLYGIQAFPEGSWTINLETFNRLVERIVSRANDKRPPGMALFVSGEVTPALIERGYKPGALPAARQPAPAQPMPTTVTIPAQPRPTPIVAIAPQPIQPPARYPLPGSVMLPVIVPPSPQFPEVALPTPRKSNAWLWIGGILTLYLLARHEAPHRSRSSRSGQDAGRSLSSLVGLEGCRDKEGKFIPVPQCTGRRIPEKELKEKAPAEPYGAFWFNVVKGGTKIKQIPKDVIGADFEKYLNADKGRSYLVFGYGLESAEKELTENLQRIREMRKEYGGGFISDSPTKQTLKLPGQPTLTYHVQPVVDYEAFTEFTKGHNVKDLVSSWLMITRGKVPAAAPAKVDSREALKYLREQVPKYKTAEAFETAFRNKNFSSSGKLIAAKDRATMRSAWLRETGDYTEAQRAAMARSGATDPFDISRGQPLVSDHGYANLMVFWDAVKAETTEIPEPVAPVPKVDRWMEGRPFTKDDTNRYNAFTFHPIDDLNDQFTGMIQPKLDEVDRLMKKYEVKEIPEEVQTGLMWYRRRAYEYLQRMIYSRLNAPGSFVVGPSNYNVKKHNKTIAGDEKYRAALDVSGKKLDTAISKTITRRKTGRKAVAVSDREKWEATAVVTKRNKFGKLTETDFIENLKKKPEPELTDWDKTLLNPRSTFRAQIRAEGRTLHARLIAEAFERGVTIDPEVVAEYPDLARPKIDLTQDDATKWRKWEERKPPILLNPEHSISKEDAYIVQDRSQRKSTEQGWDYSIVDGVPLLFDQAKSIPMIVHKSMKELGTFDVSYVPTGSLLAAQHSPLDSKTKAIGIVRDWIAQNPDGFISDFDRPSKERLIYDYPHLRDVFHDLNVAKTGKRKHIEGDHPKDEDLSDLKGIGAVLQAASTVYSLAKLAL